MGKRGPPVLEPNDSDHEAVRVMVAAGLTQESICKILRMSLPTLHKYFRDELDAGHEDVLAKVAGTLYKKAISPELCGPSITAAIFWLKTRGQWRETQGLDLTSGDRPLGTVFKMILNPTVPPDPDPDESG